MERWTQRSCHESLQQFMDAFDAEIADKQKAGKFPKPTPDNLNTPWKDSYKKNEDGTKTLVDTHNLVIFKRKVERKMRGEIVLNNPPLSLFSDSLGQKGSQSSQGGQWQQGKGDLPALCLRHCCQRCAVPADGPADC